MKRSCIVALRAVVLIAWLAGCATVTVRPVTQDDRETLGVRYYESEPYLLVTKDLSKTDTDTSTYTIKLVWLPNYNKGYAVKTTPGLGTANGNVTLADGWQLTVLGANVDSNIPDTIKAVTNLVETLGISALTQGAIRQIRGGKEKPETIPLEAGLYRLNFNEATGYVEGVERVF